MNAPLGFTRDSSLAGRYQAGNLSAPIRPIDETTNESFVQLLRSQFANGNNSPKYALWTISLSQAPQGESERQSTYRQLDEPGNGFNSEKDDEDADFAGREAASARERGLGRIYLVTALMSLSSLFSFILYEVTVIHPYLAVALIPLCVALWLITRRT